MFDPASILAKLDEAKSLFDAQSGDSSEGRIAQFHASLATSRMAAEDAGIEVPYVS